MKSWRVRGEVPDSDDENEDLSIFITPPNAQRASQKELFSHDEPAHEHLPRHGDVSGHLAIEIAGVATLSPSLPTGSTQPSTPMKSHLSSRILSHVAISSPHSPKSAYLIHSDRFDSSPPVLPAELASSPRRANGTPENHRTSISAASSPLSERIVSPSPPPGFAVDLEQSRPIRGFALHDNIRHSARNEQVGSKSVHRLPSELAARHFSNTSRTYEGVHAGHLDFQFPRFSDRHDQRYDERHEPMVQNTHYEQSLAPAHGPFARPLRIRKEKQLHPYMIDKLEYQRQCRERGMRPVRLMDPTSEAFESQDKSIQEAETLSDAGSQFLMSSPVQSPEPDVPETANIFKLSLDLESNSSTSESETTSSKTQRSSKKRKLMQLRTPSGVPQREPSRLSSIVQPVPTPPPTSSSSVGPTETLRRTRIFKRPLAMAAATSLDSPETAFASRSPNWRDSSSIVRETSQNSIYRAVGHITPSTPDAESETEVEDEPTIMPNDREDRLQRARRRIKGVLPASWLRMDLKAQKNLAVQRESRKDDRATNPSTRHSPQKGVARVIKSFASRPRAMSPAITISDADDEDENHDHDNMEQHLPLGEPTQFAQEHTPRSKLRDLSLALPDVDIMDVDWVDPMLLSSSHFRTASSTVRKPKSRRKDGPRHSRLPHNTPIVSAAKRVKPSAPSGGSSRQRREVRRSNLVRKSDSRKLLSILDAPRQLNISTSMDPQFIRLANRRARKQPGHARHSPSGKHLRLATMEETGEANVVLQQWRDGLIQPRQMLSHDVIDEQPISGAFHIEQQGSDAFPQSLRPTLADVTNARRDIAEVPSLSEIDSTSEATRSTLSIRRPNWRQEHLHINDASSQDQTEQAIRKKGFTGSRSEKVKRNKSKVVRQKRVTVPHRSGQLESLEQEFPRENRNAAFHRRMLCLTENLARKSQWTNLANISIERYVAEQHQKADQTERRSRESNNTDEATELGLIDKPRTIANRSRKRRARCVDAESRRYRQPSEPLAPSHGVEVQDHPEISHRIGDILHGLGPRGERYATTFDIVPLHIGTFFHQTSFIGSGEFASSLETGQKEFDNPTGRIRIQVDGNTFEWGPWTEDVASELTRIPKAILSAYTIACSQPSSTPDPNRDHLVAANVDYLLRSTIRYFSKCVSFLDQIDRAACVRSITAMAKELLELMADTRFYQVGDFCLRCVQYVLVICQQAYSLAGRTSGNEELCHETRQLVISSAQRLLDLQKNRQIALESFYEDNKVATSRQRGIRDHDVSVSAVVILNHVLRSVDHSSALFWTLLSTASSPHTGPQNSISTLDKSWYNIYIVLPLLEIDSTGIARLGSRYSAGTEHCELVKSYLKLLLDRFPATSQHRDLDLNGYIRAVLIRCEQLITTWGWWRCEAILITVFDFFARRHLLPLPMEPASLSPEFLNLLERAPSIQARVDDSAFHIYLKTLASALLGMRKYERYTDKKIGGIAWRLIPNHGRTHHKDSEIRQEDIDALRNHHDLLCTLYFASPPGHRLRVILIQNLVNHSVSHREACRINVRAWSNLAAFQMSTNEPVGSLEEFCDWFYDFLDTAISQYRLARSEAEQEVATANVSRTIPVAVDMVEATVAANQRQILATLIEALGALQRALRSAKSLDAAVFLLKGSRFWLAFDLFDPSTRRTVTMLNEALAVTETALEVEDSFRKSKDESQHSSEDSQEFGDSTALQEFASTQAIVPDGPTVTDILHEPFGQLLSNAFGADVPADDELLSRLINPWITIGSRWVQQGKRTWASYVDSYESYSWAQLRDTREKRKYFPYFLSRVVEQSESDLSEAEVITQWIISLAEREALLKYQHILTATVLNSFPDAALLQNLPFARTLQTAVFQISLQELRHRRLNLMSSVLSNMQRDFDSAVQSRYRNTKDVKRTYSGMLHKMMQTMKNNFLEVQNVASDTSSPDPAQGAYVDYVQQVVSFLQQYSTAICPIDEFFTNSSAFPLPASDPTYVIGKLKSYLPKLVEAGTKKQLLSFFQSLCERAAVDHQQPYLVDQLIAALTGSHEMGNIDTPSLRFTMCTSIFPAYTENALRGNVAWIIAVPVLQAWGIIIRQSMYDVILENQLSLESITSCTKAFLVSTGLLIRSCVLQPYLTELPQVCKVLSVTFDSLRVSLMTIRYISQTQNYKSVIGQDTCRLALFAARLDDQLSQPVMHEDFEPECGIGIESLDPPWPELLEYARGQVTQSIQQEWEMGNGQYFLRKSSLLKEIIADLGDEEEERGHLLERLRKFREAFDAIFKGFRAHTGSKLQSGHDLERPMPEEVIL